MLTEFGKCLRVIRIGCNELLKDMAAKLGVSSAYLSAVETGKRRIPDGWVEKISSLYHLPSERHDELAQAADFSAQEVTISLQNASPVKRGAVLSFTRALDQMSDEDLKRILQAMKSSSQKRGDRKA